MTVLALDIGGTKFAAAHVTAGGTLVRREERPIGPVPATTLSDLVADFRTPGLRAVGIGSAGPLDVRAGTVSPINIPAWRGFPLADTVRRLVPGADVALAGDGQCMALGEWWRGGHGADSLLGIVVSTGVGGGLILDGRPVLGGTGNAGHVGHVIVDRDGEPCSCGTNGCLETIASGPSMVRWALSNGWTDVGGSARTDIEGGARTDIEGGARTDVGGGARTDVGGGRPDGVTARELADDARRGARVPLAAFERAADALATVVLNTAAVADLHHVVIGGGVAAAGPLLLDPLRERLAKRAGMDFVRHVQVALTSLERDAGLYGAAALALLTTGTALHPAMPGSAG
ncbi:ROK family protein [Nonomuraea rubra]|uniref:Glucokinase n=1 Tax=Nonomuraea rubra TaxID=46180 RepID=A0A7X0NYB3_9ACTN|nr:ROK family protein [Nonomuraea rubra]MBB6551631.1 glucokinase [Nonomuraea rubra]